MGLDCLKRGFAINSIWKKVVILSREGLERVLRGFEVVVKGDGAGFRAVETGKCLSCLMDLGFFFLKTISRDGEQDKTEAPFPIPDVCLKQNLFSFI